MPGFKSKEQMVLLRTTLEWRVAKEQMVLLRYLATLEWRVVCLGAKGARLAPVKDKDEEN